MDNLFDSRKYKDNSSATFDTQVGFEVVRELDISNNQWYRDSGIALGPLSQAESMMKAIEIRGNNMRNLYTDHERRRDIDEVKRQYPTAFTGVGDELVSREAVLRYYGLPNTAAIKIRSSDLVVPSKQGSRQLMGILIPSKYMSHISLAQGITNPLWSWEDEIETAEGQCNVLIYRQLGREALNASVKVGPYDAFQVTYELGQLVRQSQSGIALDALRFDELIINDPSEEF